MAAWTTLLGDLKTLWSKEDNSDKVFAELLEEHPIFSFLNIFICF
jgi:hypothetical protein